MVEKRAAIYARVSTRKRKERNGKMVYQQDPETQLKPCREYCQRMEWDYLEYFDVNQDPKQIERCSTS
ncbi:MAG: recombinase family protein [Archaeoglobaceae archaeon]